MQITYTANRKLATSYLKISANYHFNKLLSSELKLLKSHNINHPLTRKQLHLFNNPNFNIMLAYQMGKSKAIKKINQFRNLIKQLFTYNSKIGYKNELRFHLYTVLITTKKQNFHITGSNCSNYLISDNTSNAIIHIHTVIKQLKKRLSRIHSAFKFLDDSLVVKYGDTVNPVFPHVHGLAISVSKLNTYSISNTLSNWLTTHLGYSIHCSVRTLINKSLSNKLSRKKGESIRVPVIINSSNYNKPIDNTKLRCGTTDSTNPYYPIGFSLIYINKTRDLSFISGSHGKYYSKSTDDLKHWEYLPLSIKQEYIFSVHNSIHINKPTNPTYWKINTYDLYSYPKKWITVGVHTHVYYQFNRKINKLKNIVNQYQNVFHTLNKLLYLLTEYHVTNQQSLFNPKPYQIKPVHNHFYNSNSFNKLVCSQKRIFAVREAIHNFKINYTYTNKNNPTPVEFTVGKACLTITFVAWGIHYVEPFINNFIVNLFNSS